MDGRAGPGDATTIGLVPAGGVTARPRGVPIRTHPQRWLLLRSYPIRCAAVLNFPVDRNWTPAVFKFSGRPYPFVFI